MSTEENKALICRIYELLNRGELAAYYKLLAPGYIEHLTDHDMSLEQLKQFEATFFVAFHDVSITIDNMVAEGDKVAVLVTWRGTHKEEFMGIAPSGKKIEMTNANIFRISTGRCVESWNVTDIRLAQQLGVIPTQ